LTLHLTEPLQKLEEVLPKVSDHTADGQFSHQIKFK